MKKFHFILFVALLIWSHSANAQIKVIKLKIDQTGVESCINTSIEELEGKNFELYPNPNDGDFTLKIDPSISEHSLKVEVCDNSGKVIYLNDCINPEEFSDYKISLGNITNGIYFVRIFSNSETFSKRILINK